MYVLENNITNKKYVGVTKDVERRFYEHRKQINENKPLKKNNNLYEGKIEDYSFSILENDILYSDRHDREIFWIRELDSLIPNGYNIALGQSHKHTEHHKAYMSKIMTGNSNMTEDGRKRLSDFRKQYRMTDSTKEKISKTSKDKWKDEEYRKRLSKSKKEYHEKNPGKWKNTMGKTLKEYYKTLSTEERSEIYAKNKIPTSIKNINTGEVIDFKSKSAAKKFLNLNCSGTKLNQMIKNKDIINDEYQFI